MSERFRGFLANLELTETQKTNGRTSKESVVRVLNRHYWSTADGVTHSIYVGSWGKQTRVRPPRDVDVLFTLPYDVYTRFQARVGNRQSQLLQEVRNVLGAAFPLTKIKGDGPIVSVPFVSFNVELIPAFELVGGGHWICMTKLGGSYKRADYGAEAKAISVSNSITNGNTVDLIKMMKSWQAHCSVPLKSFHIELTAIDFLNTWGNRGATHILYDWMCRDYLSYLLSRQNTSVYAPGTYESMPLGNAWVSRAQTAYERAVRACSYEIGGQPAAAGEEWQKIFGPDIPKYA